MLSVTPRIIRCLPFLQTMSARLQVLVPNSQRSDTYEEPPTRQTPMIVSSGDMEAEIEYMISFPMSLRLEVITDPWSEHANFGCLYHIDFNDFYTHFNMEQYIGS